MKRTIALALCVVCGFAAVADNWVFTLNSGSKNSGVVTDGVWKFKATIKGTDISFGNVYTNSCPDEVTALDFSKPVTDGGSTTYKIVKLDTAFGYYLNGKPHPDTGATVWIEIGYRPICWRVGELTMPTESLTEIGYAAFTDCTNATGALVFPASLQTIGTSAFSHDKKLSIAGADFPEGVKTINAGALSGVNLTGDFVLTNLATLGAGALKSSKITSLKFGAPLKSIGGEASNGAFSYCTLLTNVAFSADSAATLADGGMFRGCTQLKELNLQGIAKVSMRQDSGWYSHFQESPAERVYFSETLSLLYAYSFSGSTSLTEVHFVGMPPAAINKPYLGGISASATVVTYVHLDEDATTYDYAAAKAAWGALTEGGELLEQGSTWASTNVVSGSYKNRPLLLYVPPVIAELGHWVYDDRCDPAVVSNGVWSFKASRAGRSIMIKDVVGYPTTPTEIDFSKSLTNYEGERYSFVEVSPGFGVKGDGGSLTVGPAAPYVTRVVFPTNEFYTIGTFAFGGCTNLTEVVPCVPDFVTTVGRGAFEQVRFAPGQGDIRLYGISTMNEHIFKNSYATSVVFGPGLKSMKGHWHEDGFYNCQKLTNVVFDAAMTNCVIDGSSTGPFENCTALTGDLDLSGFSRIELGPFSGSKVTSLTFGGGLKYLCSAFCESASLTNVAFKGLPPTTFGMPYLKGNTLNDKKITTEIRWANRKATNSVGKCWLDYAADGRIYSRKSTWNSEKIVSGVKLENRPLVAPDGLGPGFSIIVQ